MLPMRREISSMFSRASGIHPTMFSMSSSLGMIRGDTALGRCDIAPMRSFTCKLQNFNEEGALHGFTDLSTLTPQSQEDRLGKYKQVHGKTVSGFLNHFAGSGTFHQGPELTVKQGVRCTALQDAMTNYGVQIGGFQGPGWFIVDVMEKLEEQVYHDVAETALADFETLKGR